MKEYAVCWALDIKYNLKPFQVSLDFDSGSDSFFLIKIVIPHSYTVEIISVINIALFITYNLQYARAYFRSSYFSCRKGPE
jgi:hypothetical protein